MEMVLIIELDGISRHPASGPNRHPACVPNRHPACVPNRHPAGVFMRDLVSWPCAL